MPGISDPNWWPTPVERQPQTLGNLIMNGWLAPVIVGVAVVALALVLSGRHSPRKQSPQPAKPTTAQTPVTPAERADAQRRALRDCLRQAGADGGFGRFGRPSQERLREAFSLCRTAVQTPAAPPAPSAAPVA